MQLHDTISIDEATYSDHCKQFATVCTYLRIIYSYLHIDDYKWICTAITSTYGCYILTDANNTC